MRRSFHALAVLCFTVPLAAQGFAPGLLDPPSTLGPASTPGSIVVADLDLDGRPDLVTTQGSPSLGLYFQLAGGGFAPVEALDFKFILGVDQPTVSDLDVDGQPDLVTMGGAGVRVRRGTGGGAFAPLQVTEGPPWTHSLAVADFDGDALPDALLAGRPPATAGQLFGAPGLGDGKFGTFGLLATPLIPYELFPADFDLDGDLDVACTEGWGLFGFDIHIATLLNAGDGSFVELPDPPALGTEAHVGGPYDLDDDGTPDLIVWRRLPGDVDALLGDGAGHFEIQDLVAPGPQVLAAACGDLDADGFIDVVAELGSDSLAGPVTFWLQRLVDLVPEGSALKLSQPGPDGTDLADLVVAPLDGDGLADVAALVPVDLAADKGNLQFLHNGVGPVADLGLGAPGGPVLVAMGEPAPGHTLGLAWQPGTAAGVFVLVVGAQAQPMALAHGLLVPEPAILVFASAPGSLSATWPAGVPVAALLYAQGVTLAADGAHAGNALLVVPQP